MTDYPDDWDQRRRDVYRRDDHTCQNCGAEGTELHAHHIQPVSEGGSHDAENLTTLCADCHAEAHDADICVICGGLAWDAVDALSDSGGRLCGGLCKDCRRPLLVKRRENQVKTGDGVPSICTLCGSELPERDWIKYELTSHGKPPSESDRFPLCKSCYYILPPDKPESPPGRLHDRIVFRWEGWSP